LYAASVGSPAYQDGRRLLVAVEQSGDRTDASAAVSVFRDALAAAPDDPAYRNGLGVALLAFARLESHERALEAFVEAGQAFETASAAAVEQGLPASARIRYQINQATTLWMLGERQDNREDIERAVQILRSVIRGLPRTALVDWPQAHDSLGNALMALGRTTEAIEAYKAAIGRWNDPDELAQTQSNLGTAYAAQGRFLEACELYRKALEHQTRERRPLAWSLTQHNFGTALWLEAQQKPPSEDRQKQFCEAIKALEAARSERQQERAPLDWAVTTINLATALVGLGVSLLSDRPPDKSTGSRHVARAISLYKEALAELTPSDAIKTVGNLFVVLEVLKTSPNEMTALEMVRGHQNDVLTIARRVGHADLIITVSQALIITLVEILFLHIRGTVVSDVTPLATILADIAGVLASSGLPRTEWPNVLRIAIDRVATSARSLPDEVVARRTVMTRRARVEARVRQKMPETQWRPPSVPLPKGLKWPEEQFDQSPEFRKHGGIVRHLDRVWRPLIAAGVIDMQILRTFYPSTAGAIDDFKHRSMRQAGEPRPMPDDLDIPLAQPGSGRRKSARLPHPRIT
jgi:tetratricopeptide (TPR) repeat protein